MALFYYIIEMESWWTAKVRSSDLGDDRRPDLTLGTATKIARDGSDYRSQ